MQFTFFAQMVEGALVLLPTLVLTWGDMFCGEKCSQIEISWLMWSVGVSIN